MALAEKTGARGLRSIIEEVMLEAMYTIPDNKDSISKCVITKESIKTKEPTIIKKGQSSRVGKL